MTTDPVGPDDSGSAESRLMSDSAAAQPPSTDSRSAQLDRYASTVRASAKSSAAAVKNAAGTSAEAVRRTTAQHNVLAIVALAIVAVSPLTVGILAPIGAILGHLSLRQLKTRQQTGRGMARAAVIIGWILTFTAPCIALAVLLGTFASIVHMIGSLVSLFD